MAHPSSLPYAGEISAAEAWQRLSADPKAQLLDVRTTAERSGSPTKFHSAVDRQVHCIEWQSFPSGARNPGFVTQVNQSLNDREALVLVLCRSGARSRAAAIALTEVGFRRAFNVSDGFEGDTDQEGHRGNHNGWKAANLPWRQG